jgi:hypothetical protein
MVICDWSNIVDYVMVKNSMSVRESWEGKAIILAANCDNIITYNERICNVTIEFVLENQLKLDMF